MEDRAAMLQKLGDHIQSCLHQAEQCKVAAASEPEDRVRSQLLSLEQQWQQHVAKSYEFIASLERYQQKNTLPNEVEQFGSVRRRDAKPDPPLRAIAIDNARGSSRIGERHVGVRSKQVQSIAG